MKMNVMIDGQTYEVNVEDVRTRPVIATVDGERFEVWPEAESPDPNQTPAPSAPAISVPESTQGATPFEGAEQTGGTRDIIAPLPGVIAAILVEQGDEVSYGQELCTLEAMKMKNAIRANRAGCIESIDVSVGDQVVHSQVLMKYAE